MVVAPTTLGTRVVVVWKSRLSSPPHQFHIWVVWKFFANSVNESSICIASQEIDYVVGAKERERNPNVNDYKNYDWGHFVPLHCQVLGWKNRGRSDMTRKVEVVRIKVWHRQRMNTWVTPQKANGTSHEENSLNHISHGVEKSDSTNYAHRVSPHPKDKQERQHHPIDANWWLNDQEVFPANVRNEELVDGWSPDECVVPEAFTLCQDLFLLVLCEGQYNQHDHEQSRKGHSSNDQFLVSLRLFSHSEEL